MHVLSGCGHSVHEDVPDKVREMCVRKHSCGC